MSVLQIEKHLEDAVKLFQISRKGIKYKVFESIVKSGPFSIKDWCKFLHLTDRTLQRYNKAQKSFEDIHAQRILQVAKFQSRGKEIFGSVQSFGQWMNGKNVALGGLLPIDLVSNSFGLTMLNDELTRIEYGVLA